MAVEDDEDLAAFFDEADFAVPAEWRSAGTGAPAEVSVVFDDGHAASPQVGVPADSREITARCLASAIVGAAQGDTLTVAGVIYRVRDVRADGRGTTWLVLGI